MTTPAGSDPTPLFPVEASEPLTPVEQLLVLADLYTRHHAPPSAGPVPSLAVAPPSRARR
jgi:hypothetical protein